MKPDSRIYVAGHRGLVGSAILRRLKREGYTNLITRRSGELDLRNQAAVAAFFESERPEFVFLAAAKVGGILANDSYPADFIRDNLQIQTNVIDASYRSGVQKLAFLGSSCIYPKFAPQPMGEDCLLTGSLESTNEWYAVAKIAGIKMCQAYKKQYGFNAVSLMPTNLYGPNDNFDLTSSHVLPAMLRKFHLAKLAQARDLDAIAEDEQRYGKIPEDVLYNMGVERVAEGVGSEGSAPFRQINAGPSVTLWGSGSPYREFLHVDDMTDACLFIMGVDLPDDADSSHLYNIGVGEDVTIEGLARLIQEITAFDGDVLWDHSKPDGTPRKLMDVSRINAMGWKARISLQAGVRAVYQQYLQGAVLD